MRAIREQNVQVAAGVGGRPPSPGPERPAALDQRAGPPATEEEFGDIIVKTERNGEVARLRDVARIELGAAVRAALAARQQAGGGDRHLRAPGSNAIQISDNVRETMDELKRFPRAWTTDRLRPDAVRARLDQGRGDTLLEAIALVVLVVILFLQTWRASIIPLVAVPVSIVGTFAALYLLGFSINTLTPVRPGAGDRHRGRRRDRGGGERRAQHRGGPARRARRPTRR